jgi:site-specific DNA-methyltransferase (adenine-specific)
MKKAAGKPMICSAKMAAVLDGLIEGDCCVGLAQVPDQSVHLILSDIPYGIGAETWDVLHDNTNNALLGASPAQKKAGAIFSKRGKPINGWSEADRAIPRQYYAWCRSWTDAWYRVLKPGASAIVFAGRRYAHRCICAMEDSGFSLKDMLAWSRERAPHRAQRLSVVFERRGDALAARQWEGWRVGNLRPTFEPILWFTKPYKIGTTLADNALEQGVGPYNEEAFTGYFDAPDNILACGMAKGEGGLHPTQKPLRLMQALIELTTQAHQTVLDPFAGCGTTLVAAKTLRRHYIGFELDPTYAQLCRERLAAISTGPCDKA